MIRKYKGKYRVLSESGRNMGTYNTKEEAKKRLRQIEFFKHKYSSFDKKILIKIADYLDQSGLYNLADEIDIIFEKEILTEKEEESVRLKLEELVSNISNFSKSESEVALLVSELNEIEEAARLNDKAFLRGKGII